MHSLQDVARVNFKLSGVTEEAERRKELESVYELMSEHHDDEDGITLDECLNYQVKHRTERLPKLKFEKLLLAPSSTYFDVRQPVLTHRTLGHVTLPAASLPLPLRSPKGRWIESAPRRSKMCARRMTHC